MFYRYFLLFFFSAFVILGCNKEDSENEPSKNYTVKGVAQKGPFKYGSVVTLEELDKDFKPTGIEYTTQVNNNLGNYEFTDVELKSEFARLSVEGLYFHENRGGYATGEELKISALVHLDQSNDININILTHLEQARAFELIEKGNKFSEATTQAHNELLSQFHIDGNMVKPARNCNLSDGDYSSEVLFAISNIMINSKGSPQFYNIPQGVGEITADFEKDGKFNDAVVQEIIASSALLLNLDEAAQTLKDFYTSQGAALQPAANNKILEDFIKQTTYPMVTDGVFPASAGQHQSFFSHSDSIFLDSSEDQMMAVDLSTSTKLTWVRVSVTNGTGDYMLPSNWQTVNDEKFVLIRKGDPLQKLFFNLNGSGSFDLNILVLESAGTAGAFRTKKVVWSDI